MKTVLALHHQMKQLVLALLPDPAYPECEPLEELKLLLRCGLMPNLSALWGQLPADCHLIVDAAMRDLIATHCGWLGTGHHRRGARRGGSAFLHSQE